MKTFNNAYTVSSLVLGRQKIDKTRVYRPIFFLVTTLCNDGTLAYNTLTGQGVLLDDDEATLIKKEKVEYFERLNELIENWFLVPLDNNDTALSDSLHTMFNALMPKPDLSQFTIFTTTDCNARCFYCYELGRSRIAMSDDTAKDVADYIIKASKGKEVNLTWFGGEPLFNRSVIDIICEKLRNTAINFKSLMVSNAYLFNEKLIKSAKNDWNLQKIQITLDGTEEIYNKTKAYIYKDGTNPFTKVINNIQGLLERGITVNIRLNVNKNNADNLYSLCDYLAGKFSSYKNFSVYFSLILEYSDFHAKTKFEKEENYMYEKLFELEQHAENLKILNIADLGKKFKTNFCMADSDRNVTILPEGELGKCEHFSESEFFGSIYNDKIDYGVLNSFKEKYDKTEECNTCFYYPRCIRLKKCADLPTVCTELERIHRKNALKRSITKKYNECFSLKSE